MKLDNPVYIFKIMTINSDQDSEHLSISDCHSSKLNSVLLAHRDISERTITVCNYVLKKEKCKG